MMSQKERLNLKYKLEVVIFFSVIWYTELFILYTTANSLFGA